MSSLLLNLECGKQSIFCSRKQFKNLPNYPTLAQCNAVFQASTGKKLQGKNYEKITGPGNMVPNIQLVIEWH